MKLTALAAPEPASVGAAPAAAAPPAAVAKTQHGKRRPARCHVPRGGTVITKTRQVLVYETSQQNTFYCPRSNGRRIRTGRA